MNSLEDESIIQLYCKLLRDLVNYAAKRIESRTFLEKIKSRLGFENIEGWGILTSSMDLIDDTELAKRDYFIFQLVGPTRYDNIGEMYLRFYGILNSVYLQTSAISELAELFKINNKHMHIKLLESLPIIQLRHIAGSHTVNYLDPVSNRKRTFMIAQHSLQHNKIEIMDDENKLSSYDLHNILKEYDSVAESVLDIISEKAIDTICKTDKKGKSTFTKQLNRIQQTANGSKFIDLPDGKTLRIEYSKKNK